MTKKLVKIQNEKYGYTIEETRNGSFLVYNTKNGKGWRISKEDVHFNRLFEKNWIPKPAMTIDNKPILCTKCNKPTVFKLGNRKVAEELVIVYYGCTSCGYVEKEPID